MRRLRLAASILLGLILASAGQVPAQTKTWDGGAGTKLWSDDANWDPDGVPTATDDVEITGVDTVFVDTSTTVNSLASGTALTVSVAETLTTGDFSHLTSGTFLQGDGTLLVTGSMTWSRGTIAGNLTIGSGATLTITGDLFTSRVLAAGATLQIDGTMRWLGSQSSISMQGGSVMNNTGTVDDQGSSALSASGSPTPVFNNSGTYQHTGPAKAIASILNNTGLVSSENNAVNLQGGGTSPGDFQVSAGAVINFRATHDLAGADITGAGKVIFESGTSYTLTNGSFDLDAATGQTSIADPDVTFAASVNPLSFGQLLTISGGTTKVEQDASVPRLNIVSNAAVLEGPGAITVTDSMTWTRGTIATDMTIDVGASLTIIGDLFTSRTLAAGVTLQLDGTTNWTQPQASLSMEAGSVISNTGTFNDQASTSTNLSASGVPTPTFNNAGSYKHTGANRVVQADFNNTGILDLAANDMLFSSDFSNGSTGIVQGNGKLRIQNATSFTNDGTFAPGTSPGLLSVEGNYAMNAGALLHIEIDSDAGAGIGHDVLDVDGGVAQGGTLDVDLTGVVPAGDYTIVTFTGALVDNFASVDLPPNAAIVRPTDPGGLAGQIFVRVNPALSVTETVTVSDGPNLLQSLPILLTETVTVSDDSQLLEALLLSLSESITVSDDPHLLEALLVSLTESISVSDDPHLLEVLLLSLSESIGVSDDPIVLEALVIAITEAVAVTDAPDLLAALLLQVQEAIAVADSTDIEFPAATALEIPDGDGLIDFGPDVAADIDFVGLSCSEDSSAVRVLRYDSGPRDPVGIGEDALSDYRWVIEAVDCTFDSTTEVCFSLSELPDPGIADPPSVLIYRRPQRSSPFEAVPTEYAEATHEICGQGFTSFSEFVFAGPSSALPVEFTSFTAFADGGVVRLSWATAAETNNAGFEVQRLRDGNWEVLGFVDGHGTTFEPQTYQFVDDELPFEAKRVRYRLKQTDFDGSFLYSAEVEVRLTPPPRFKLHPAYPNPFNPQTTIRYEVPEASQVRLAVYDAVGREVAVLVAGRKEAGRYHVSFDASRLSTGLYVYRIDAGSFSDARMMMLVK